MSTPTIRAALQRLVELSKRHAVASVWDGAFFDAHAALAAEPVWEGPPAVTISALLHPAYEPGDGSADGAQMVGLAWWNPVMGCDSLQIVVDNARNILRSRWARPAAPPAPKPGEVGELVDMLSQGAVALDSLCNKIVNGECTTSACFHRGGWIRGAESPDPSVATCPELEKAAAMRRAATLLQQRSAPAPAVVPVAVEALTRLYWWGGMRQDYGYSADVVLGVRHWIDGGMVGGLPQLPRWIADRCPPLPFPPAPAPAVVPVAVSEWGGGFMDGVCAALATVTAHGASTVWREIVRSVGVDNLLNYAANVSPGDWDLAGFSEYAQPELGKGKPLPPPQGGEGES